MSGLKRSNTLQTIKRAGTGAWKWINAEDVNINENKPIGHSYFQRSNTYKKLQAENGGTGTSYQARQRPAYNNQSYSNSNSFTPQGQPGTAYSARAKPENSYSVDVDDNTNYNNSYSNNNDYNTQSNTDNSYVTDIKKPEPAAEKESNKKKSKINRVPTVLYDPKVRKQLEEMKQYKPYFMYITTAVQIIMMFVSMYVNYTYENKFITSTQNNLMLGPNSNALIHLGARFVPCMKDMEENFHYPCPPNIKGNITIPGMEGTYCTIGQYCGLGGIEEGKTPNQWIRFILPIFLHGGIIHLIVNLTFQIRTGIQMEKDFGTWRMIIIYMASGIFGFAFGANFSTYTTSVGCSGALYGLLACLLLDLIQNWKLIIKPWIELIKMSSIIIISLGVGLLPFIDNFAHVGGFIIGILTGLVFMPTIIFSKWDLRRKRFLMVISIVLLFVAFIWVFKQFYDVTSECKWCKYVNCLPINGWCDDTNIH